MESSIQSEKSNLALSSFPKLKVVKTKEEEWLKAQTEEAESPSPQLRYSIKSSPSLVVGDKVRHTRFLNTNSPGGVFILEILDSKALCQYEDSIGKTKQTWFLIGDLIKA